jgi:hypothetical protein
MGSILISFAGFKKTHVFGFCGWSHYHKGAARADENRGEKTGTEEYYATDYHESPA